MYVQAALLLPTTPASSSLQVTAANVREHIAFVGPPLPSSSKSKYRDQGENESVMVLLSDLMGTMKESVLLPCGLLELTSQRSSTIYFESKIDPPASEAGESSIPSNLARFRSAHFSHPAAQAHFPLYALSSQSATLRFPSSSDKSSAITDDLRAPTARLARMNPFASLFGGQSSVKPPDTSEKEVPEILAPSSLAPSSGLSPRPSLSSLTNDGSSVKSSEDTAEGYRIQAYTISKTLRRNDIDKSISKAAKAIIKDILNGLPDKVIDRVLKLVLPVVAPLSAPADDKGDTTSKVTFDFADPSSVGQKLQEFIEKVYDDLLIHCRADSSHIFSETSHTGSRLRQKASWTRRSSKSLAMGEDESEEAKFSRKQKARKEKEEMVEREATAGAEKVEAIICRFFYNRISHPQARMMRDTTKSWLLESRRSICSSYR